VPPFGLSTSYSFLRSADAQALAMQSYYYLVLVTWYFGSACAQSRRFNFLHLVIMRAYLFLFCYC
jgi:hypothetical protein